MTDKPARKVSMSVFLPANIAESIRVKARERDIAPSAIIREIVVKAYRAPQEDLEDIFG